jgi:hydroxymethylpyrimidine/phosphomethylpyrimidine kinase
MLASKETIDVVADAIEKYEVPLSVIDPVNYQLSRFNILHD